MVSFGILVLALVAGMSVVALVNVLLFRRLDREARPAAIPLISVLLPVRNEERNIGDVLRTLATQDYPRFEVIVLDDGSEDSTGAIASRFAASDPRFRVVRGGPLPDGWVGKSHACHQLSREARGDLLLFVDADTVHEQWSVRSAVAEMERTGAGLLSAIPGQRMESFWEKTVLPLLHFSTFCFLPMPLVSSTRNPKLAMANGQFMLFRRDAYERIGGHASVKTALVEDVWLSRRIKEFGLTLAVRDGSGTIAARMYRSLGEIWNGFSKNLFAGFRYSLPAITAVILFNLATSILPFVLVGVGAVLGPPSGEWLPIVLWQSALVIAIRLMIALRFRLAVWPALVHPLAMAVFIGIALNSVRCVVFGGGARWKGRRYDFRNQPVPQP